MWCGIVTCIAWILANAVHPIWKLWHIIGIIWPPGGRSVSRTVVHWLSKYTHAEAWFEALFHSRSRTVPDHWPEKRKKKQIIASEKNFRSYAFTITEETFATRDNKNNTYHSHSHLERQRMVEVPQSGAAPARAPLTYHPWYEPLSSAPRSGHLKHALSLSNS